MHFCIWHEGWHSTHWYSYSLWTFQRCGWLLPRKWLCREMWRTSHAILTNYKWCGKGPFDNDMKQYITEHNAEGKCLSTSQTSFFFFNLKVTCLQYHWRCYLFYFHMRTNIWSSVVTLHAENIEGRFSWLATEQETKRNQLPKVILFAKLISNCSAIHMTLSRNCAYLEKHIAVFHSITHDDQKKEVLDNFVKADRDIRILLCTSAFGMGVDILKIHSYPLWTFHRCGWLFPRRWLCRGK